jgi:hypothetical protein
VREQYQLCLCTEEIVSGLVQEARPCRVVSSTVAHHILFFEEHKPQSGTEHILEDCQVAILKLGVAMQNQQCTLLDIPDRWVRTELKPTIAILDHFFKARPLDSSEVQERTCGSPTLTLAQDMLGDKRPRICCIFKLWRSSPLIKRGIQSRFLTDLAFCISNYVSDTFMAERLAD